MTSSALTEKGVERLRPDPAKRVEVWDKTLPAFGLRITPRGIKSFVVMRRVNGRNKRITLGRYPELSVKQARDKARTFLGEMRDGQDPSAAIAARQTFEAVLEQCLERHVRPNCAPRHAKETERILRREALPRWGHWPIEDIRRAQVIELLDTIKDRGAPIMANRVKAALSKLFRFAVERGHIDMSPLLMVSAPSRERAREHVLSGDDLKAVWDAGNAFSFWTGRWFRFHMLTAQRLNETAALRWAEIDLEKALWVLPAERSKNGKVHSVPLPAPAIAQIADLPRCCEYVFSTTGKGPIHPSSKLKKRLQAASGVDGWTYHDLRRSAATWLESAGYSEKEIALVLNHQRASVTSIYARADLLEKKREMLDAWATHLSGGG